MSGTAAFGRVVFLDVLRVLIISMVIIHHAAQAYGPTGGFWPVKDTATSDWFRPFYTVNAAVGLGLLFLLAGFLLPGPYERKGSRRFLKERWARLGVPLVFFILVVNIPLMYFMSGRPDPVDLIRGLYNGAWQGAYLHLWFLGHLLLYSVVYVVWARRAGSPGRARMLPPPSHTVILVFAAALILVTWVVRWWFPVDHWVPLFYVLPAEPANLAQYLSLFVLGIVAFRNDWFRRIPLRVGLVWLVVGGRSRRSRLLAPGVQPVGRPYGDRRPRLAFARARLIGSADLHWTVRGTRGFVPRGIPQNHTVSRRNGHRQLRRLYSARLRRRQPSDGASPDSFAAGRQVLNCLRLGSLLLLRNRSRLALCAGTQGVARDDATAR